jgi:molecular chaperone DnaK
MVLLDVTPLSLGIETLGGVMTVLISRNTTIPTRKEEVFSTADDNQGKVEVHVLQGERAEARHNRTLGKFHLDGILPAPRGVPKIKVTFDIDANGILSVGAVDEATGKQQKVTITAGSGLTDSDIERMVKDAQAHEEEDKKRREEVENRNKADQLCHGVEKALADVKDKLPADKVADIEAKVKSLREAIDKNDDALIKTRMETLDQAMRSMAELAYAAAGAQGGPGAGGGPTGAGGGAAGASGSGKKDEGVIDAEFEESNCADSGVESSGCSVSGGSPG